MAEIRFTEGPLAGDAHTLSETEILVIGRAENAGLTVPDPLMSGRHTQIWCEDGVWSVKDLDSSNGTHVNGKKVVTRPLVARDRVGVGNSTFVFTLDNPQSDGPVAGESTIKVGAPAPLTEARSPEVEPSGSRPDVTRIVPAKKVDKASREDVDRVRKMKTKTNAIRKEVAKVIVGQSDVLDQVLMCLIAGGHGLLVGLPGMAKTLMVRTIAQVLDLSFKRIQFTPDLMPSDITGTDVLETNKDNGEKEFRFIRGPIFCNLLLADEINRTPPKTQAALLEAMQEQRVTVGNETFGIEVPFFVLATQNPIEQEGTYPLPEAQLDRFMFNIWVDYPLESEEEEIVGATTVGDSAVPDQVLTRDEVLQLQDVVRKIPVSKHVIKYAIRLVRATRPVYTDSPQVTRDYVSTGAGPRAGQYLVLAAKARAVLEGRIHVSCADIRQAAIPVLRHRILTNFAADSEGLTSMSVVNRLLEEVKEPDEKAYGA